MRAGNRFAALAEAILYQQLAGKAAASIHARFVTSVGGAVTPESVLVADPGALRAAGLSAAKAGTIHDLAEHIVSGQIALDRIGRLPDEQIVEHLTRVRGIGPVDRPHVLADHPRASGRVADRRLRRASRVRPGLEPRGGPDAERADPARRAVPTVPEPRRLVLLGRARHELRGPLDRPDAGEHPA